MLNSIFPYNAYNMSIHTISHHCIFKKHKNLCKEKVLINKQNLPVIDSLHDLISIPRSEPQSIPYVSAYRNKRSSAKTNRNKCSLSKTKYHWIGRPDDHPNDNWNDQCDTDSDDDLCINDHMTLEHKSWKESNIHMSFFLYYGLFDCEL